MFLRSLESVRLGIFLCESSTMHRHCDGIFIPFDPLLVDKKSSLQLHRLHGEQDTIMRIIRSTMN